MRRVVIGVVVVGVLALPVSAGALQASYNGSPAYLLLKGKHKKKIKLFGVDQGVALQCDEGKVKSIPVGETWSGAQRPKVKRGKFHLRFTEKLKFQVIDAEGYVTSTTKGELVIKVKGRFKNDFAKASGTLTMSGDHPGPESPPYYEPPHFHNCESGTVDWKAKRGAVLG